LVLFCFCSCLWRKRFLRIVSKVCVIFSYGTGHFRRCFERHIRGTYRQKIALIKASLDSPRHESWAENSHPRLMTFKQFFSVGRF
jgi:hypothetical protein